MAQTKRKRRTKHRGTAAGSIETRGRTGRPPAPGDKKRTDRQTARDAKLNKPPTWIQSFKRGGLAATFMFVFLLLTDHPKHSSVLPSAVLFAALSLVLYVPAGFYLEMFLYRRRMAKQGTVVKR